MQKKIKPRVLNYFRRFFMFPFCEEIIASQIAKKNCWFYKKLAPNYYQYPHNSMRVFKANGINLSVDISDYIGHYTYFRFEDKTLNTLLANIKENNNVFDIGANIGVTTLNIAKKASSGNVFSFEPDPINFNKLSQNVSQNTFNNINLNQFGLGNKNERLKLYVVNEGNLGGNKINQTASSNYNWVTLKKLDDFIDDNKIKKVDVIKIDVEGFEYNVLKGGEKSIKTHKPICVIEIDDKNLKEQGASAKEVILFLEKYYNKIIKIDNNSPVKSSDSFENCHFDLITFP